MTGVLFILGLGGMTALAMSRGWKQLRTNIFDARWERAASRVVESIDRQKNINGRNGL